MQSENKKTKEQIIDENYQKFVKQFFGIKDEPKQEDNQQT